MGTSSNRTDKRTTISLDAVVYQWADDLMREKGYNNNFSAYVAELIRRDRERWEERQIALGKSSSSGYPEHAPSATVLNEETKKAKPKKAA